MSVLNPRVLLLGMVIILCITPDTATSYNTVQYFDEMDMYGRLDKYERRRYEGLRYLMSDFQKRQYLSSATREERDEWIVRFWKMIDPNPTTEKNERKIEHEERIEAARARYPKKDFPGWDRRGETLIRFGEPAWIKDVQAKLTQAESMTEDFDLMMPGEIWHYPKLNMVVPFEETNLDGECTYYMKLKTISRQTAWEFAKAGAGNLYADDAFFEMTDLFTYHPSNVEELRFAATEELLTFYSNIENNRYFHKADIERVQLECYFDFTSFWGGKGKLRTEVNFEIPLSELAFERRSNKSCSRIEASIVAFDMDMKEVASSSEIVNLELPETVSGHLRYLIPAQFILTMDPGYYRFGLEVKDLISKKQGCYRISMRLDPLGDALCLSDIQLASSIGYAEGKDTFVKGTLRVVPHPLHTYRKPDPLKLYFEIYGLDTSEEDMAFYSVEYSIEPKQKKRWGPVLKDVGTVISSKFETSAYGSTQHERIEIDTSSLWEGVFTLSIRVMDRRTMESAERMVGFSILE